MTTFASFTVRHRFRALATLNALLTLISCSLLAGCASTTHADNTPIDCSVSREDLILNRCPAIKQASEFSGCLSNHDISEHTCLVMDADVTFCDSSVVLPITAVFDRNNHTLDCSDGSINHGQGRDTLQGGPSLSGTTRLPGVRLMEDRSLSGITVQNCNILGTEHMGIQATRFFGGELGPDGALDEGEPLPEGHQHLTFKDITIKDVVTGIYLGNFSNHVDIQRVHIDNSARIAIYSDAGSHNLRIRESIISNNRSREAIAIDSTYDSEVSNTLFVNNREGGINLYQNCGELKGIVCPVVRSTPPNNNRITGNQFVHTGVSGVQIASRQGRNHSLGWCASLYGLPGKFTDTAEGNTVSDNTFVCSEGTSLVVLDGPNIVSDNTIVARENCVPLEISTGGHGASKRSLLDGLELQGNRIDATRPPRLRNLSEHVSIQD